MLKYPVKESKPIESLISSINNTEPNNDSGINDIKINTTDLGNRTESDT